MRPAAAAAAPCADTAELPQPAHGLHFAHLPARHAPAQCLVRMRWPLAACRALPTTAPPAQPQAPAPQRAEHGLSVARRSVQDYVLTKHLYRGKASTLYLASCRLSGQTVVLKAYSKRRLSSLNWCAAQCGLQCWCPAIGGQELQSTCSCITVTGGQGLGTTGSAPGALLSAQQPTFQP